MAKEHMVKTVFRGLERLNNSRMANPSFMLYTDAGTFRMETDASLGYGIENYLNSNFPETYIVNREVTLVTTAAGKVYAIELDGRRLT